MSDPSTQPSSGGVQLTPKAITALVITAAAVIFIFSNKAVEEVSFLWLKFSAPGWVLYLTLFLAGLAVGFFLGRNRYKRRS